MRILKFLIFTALLLSVNKILAQTYGNEWIDYNKQYYKISIYSNGIYRINMQTLFNAGMPTSTTGSSLQMFRDGKEVPLYVANNGTLQGTDNIEFYGKKADGLLDSEVYKSPSFQVNRDLNLIYDTAFYFLTINTTNANMRFVQSINSVSGTLPIAEPYCWDKISTYNRNYYLPGVNYSYNESYQSSHFDEGEGLVFTYISNPYILNNTLINLYKQTGSPNINTQSKFVGYPLVSPSNYNHTVKVTINNIDYADSTFSGTNGCGTKIYNIDIPSTSFPSNNILSYKMTPHNIAGNDRVGIAYININYPKMFNFSNVEFKQFEMDAKPNPYYIEITNYNNANQQPKLFDITNNKMYLGDISIAGKIRYLLPSTTTRTVFYLINQIAANYIAIPSVTNVTFENLLNPNRNGDFLILTNKQYYNDGTGHNYVQDYANYRQSVAGGSKKVSIVDFQQIYDQFGYGNNMHVAGVRRFLKFAKNNWTVKPDYLFIIGKGIEFNNYVDWAINLSNNPTRYPYNSVTPTFGLPGSDILMADINKDNVQDFKVGRLSIFTPSQINDYLTKVKVYEAQQLSTSYQMVDSIAWKKQVLHIGGGKTLNEQSVILSALNFQKTIIQDTTFGGNVFTINKQTTNNIDVIESAHVDSLMNTGVGLIQYYGHASPTKLEYGVNELNTYSNYGKYSIFMANGCDAGYFFGLNDFNTLTLTEKALMEPNKGSIAFISGVALTYTGNIEILTDTLYNQFTKNAYLTDIGSSMKYNVKVNTDSALKGSLFKSQFEQVLLNGDPMIKFNNFSKPDYDVELKYVSNYPLTINSGLDSFKLSFSVYNLSKFQNDSISLVVRRNINGLTNNIIYQKNYPHGIAFSDSILLNIPIDKKKDKGLNNFEISIDDYNLTTEVTKTNNKVTKQITIYDDDIIPVFPYQYSILHNQNLKLIANTSNPFSLTIPYIIQIDTTKNFNSTLLKTNTIQSAGGVIEWNPNIVMSDSVVYYWRVAKDSLFANGERNWQYSSFVFLKNGTDGWSQSHYYQYLNDKFTGFKVDSNRLFNFDGNIRKLSISCIAANNSSLPVFSTYSQYISFNEGLLFAGGCGLNKLQFVIIDSLTGAPIHSADRPNWGGNTSSCGLSTDMFFEFPFSTSASRKNIMNFIDSIPNGYYIGVMPFVLTGNSKNTVFAPQMAADTTIFGSGNSLYHKLKQLGFTKIDSFTSNKPFVFFTRKGIVNYPTVQTIKDSTNNIIENFTITANESNGVMESPLIGKASKWTNLLKNAFPRDGLYTDTSYISVYGVDTLGVQSPTPLANVYGIDTSLSFINANQYPYLKLRYNSTDNLHKTAEQLHYWRVMYNPVADAAIAPNLNFIFKNNYQNGEPAPLQFAVKNVTSYPLDSMNVRCTVSNASGSNTEVFNTKIKPLTAFDTTIVKFANINTKLLNGNSSLFLEVNPAKNPIEQTYNNNIANKLFFVSGDKINPIIDATFDGVHILKDDIVSTKPFIKFKIKDENKFLKLDDSSSINLSIRNPGTGSFIPVNIDNDTVKFIPASNSENAAYVEYRPKFTVDGIYELQLSAKDKSGNSTGSNAYKTSFTIITKESISNIINYPNPFSTSTQFVFTLTGSFVPSFMKIQILTVSGKIVKEITKNELGNIHVGKNITDYRWDGTDQYGQKLGNGVYFYRLISNENGKQLDNYTISEVDKTTKHGFGKLYIMR